MFMTLISVRKYQQQLREERERARRREDHFSDKLRQRSAKEKEREKTMLELINESNRLRDHYRDETARREQSMPLPVTVVNPGTLKLSLNRRHRADLRPRRLIHPS